MNGGEYVKEHGYGHEEFNFMPVMLDDEYEPICLGFVEPKSNSGKRNSLHIEKIEGCNNLKHEPVAKDVLIIWCATRQQKDVTVVGWYRHAIIWRELQSLLIDNREQTFNIKAKASDCMLLPEGERNVWIWKVPSGRSNPYGFGQSLVWYAREEGAQDFLQRLVNNIDNYDGENWLNRYPME